MEIATGADLTSAFIDLITSLVLVPLTILLSRKDGDPTLKKMWVSFLSLLCVSNFIGFVVHFFILEELVLDIIWIFEFAFMFGLVVMFFLIAMRNITGNAPILLKWLLLVLIATLLTYIASIIISFNTVREIRVFVIYAAIFVATSIVLYCVSDIKHKRKSFIILLSIALPQLFGLYFQLTKDVNFHFIVDFDHNGIYHSMLLISVILFYFTGRKNLQEIK